MATVRQLEDAFGKGYLDYQDSITNNPYDPYTQKDLYHHYLKGMFAAEQEQAEEIEQMFGNQEDE